ncbi:MAG: thiamine pyrophosphate-dependent enzyme, partial [Acidimicrobiales bacterium]
PAGGFPLLANADVVVAVGTRFAAPETGSARMRPGAQLVRIDTSPHPANRQPVDGVEVTAVAADAKLALGALIDRAESNAAPQWRARAAALKQEIARALGEEFPVTAECCRAIRAATPADGIIVDEMTQVAYLGRNAIPIPVEGEYIISGFQGTLGYGYPTALGAKVAAPGRAVVSITGDGGFGYNVGELATAVQHNIGVVAVVFCDDAFGNVLGIQERTTGRPIASRLHNPDYVALAASFGMAGTRVEDVADLEVAISEAIAADVPTLIEVPLGPQPNVWPRVTGALPFELPEG